mgnify:CR=1 FL=1
MKTAWLVWEYECDYGPDEAYQYFSPTNSKIFMVKKDAELYAKKHNKDVDEVELCIV